jgi:nicotinamidase-related amidase
MPVFYANFDDSVKTFARWPHNKCGRRSEVVADPATNKIVKEIAPVPGDVVVLKTRPSIFFGTPFVTMLTARGIDTLIMCGTTTSGCVRASVVDAFSYGYKVVVIEEATFDRGQVSHQINLFDMNAKYADVLSVSEVTSYIKSL